VVKVKNTINCEKDCINGCVLGEDCPNQGYAAQASKFIQDTSLDKMLEMAETARLKKITEPPKWIIPDDF
jgi:hypothetical protein